MVGKQLAGKWQVIHAIGTGPNGQTVGAITNGEAIGIRTIYRNLKAFQVDGFPIYPEKSNESNRGALIDTFGLNPSDWT
jgi:hypothetical protein